MRDEIGRPGIGVTVFLVVCQGMDDAAMAGFRESREVLSR
jgi:hypothetical protein